MGNPFTVDQARYAKRMLAVRVTGDGSGFMTRAQRLANYFGRSRYSHREGAYLMSPQAVEKLQAAWTAGQDASPITGKLREGS